MTALIFDTLKYANTLKAAGVASEQAEAQANALSEVLEVNLKELATKDDLIQLEQRMTIKLGSMMVVAIAVVAALTKLL